MLGATSTGNNGFIIQLPPGVIPTTTTLTSAAGTPTGDMRDLPTVRQASWLADRCTSSLNSNTRAPTLDVLLLPLPLCRNLSCCKRSNLCDNGVSYWWPDTQLQCYFRYACHVSVVSAVSRCFRRAPQCRAQQPKLRLTCEPLVRYETFA